MNSLGSKLLSRNGSECLRSSLVCAVCIPMQDVRSAPDHQLQLPPAELCSPPVLRLPHRHPSAPRFESHIWESKKQIYLGGFDTEALAAKAHGERLASSVPGR